MDLLSGLRKRLPGRPLPAPAPLLLRAAVLAAFLLPGCQREYDNPYLPRSEGYAGPEWSADGDGDGVSDSVEKYAPDCSDPPESCLRKAQANAGLAEGLDSVTAEDLDLVAGGPPVEPRLRWHPPSASAPYTLVSDNPAAAAAEDSRVKPLAPGQAVFTVTVRAASGPARTARFRCTVAAARVRVASIAASDLSLRAGETAVPDVRVLPADATDKAYELLTHDPGIAEVRGDALLGIAPGTTRVTARSRDGGREAVFQVAVGPRPAPVKAVNVEDMRFTLLDPADARIKAPVIAWTPADAADKGYSLVSEDPAIARVVGGSVEARKGGETKVTLTTRDGGKQDTFKVKVAWLLGCGDLLEPCEDDEED